MDEIPVAEREVNPEKKKSALPNNIVFILGGSLILLMAMVGLLRIRGIQPVSQDDSQITALDETASEATTDNDLSETSTPNNAEEKQTLITEHILGHLPYEQAPLEELEAVTSDGRIMLRSSAAKKFLQMQQDAKRQGISLVPISGFRTVSEQEYLFFDIKAQRVQDTSTRAEVSAPPGYSEHHTGYAIDIGDAQAPATNLSPSFEQTPAYQWLIKNAPKYSFELSFPKDNLQGISYEPWHWRYVGDTDSLKTFYKARELKTNLQ